MAVDLNKGYDDQELLLRALVTFVCTQVNRSEQIIWGLLRQSINDWTAKNNVSFKELKSLSEAERLKAVTDLIDDFVEKIKHLMDSKFQREKLKASALQIYAQWKDKRRQAMPEN